MSHEIRTPMNAILGHDPPAARTGPRAEQAERLDKIDAAAHHLLAIINDDPRPLQDRGRQAGAGRAPFALQCGRCERRRDASRERPQAKGLQ